MRVWLSVKNGLDAYPVNVGPTVQKATDSQGFLFIFLNSQYFSTKPETYSSMTKTGAIMRDWKK